MMRIRVEQMRAFERAAEERFVDRLVQHLREHHGQATVKLPGEIQQLENLSELTLKDLVRRGVARARAFGLTWESTITGFVAIMFEVAPNFDRTPVAQAVRQASLDISDARLNLLLAAATSDDWERAELGYDPAGW